MKSRRKIFIPVIIIMIVVLSGVGFWIFQRNNRLVKQTISVNVSYDYPVTSSLEEMTEAADLIVAGRYTGLDSIWNMRRNPNDVNEEDVEHYVEGHLYNFELDDIIKGEADSDSILVNHRYSEQMSYTESNAITDEYGSIIQAATEENEITFTAPDPLFIEPELGATYMLFLLKDENFDNYYGAIEPFSIKFEDGVASLQSNLIDNGNTVSQEIPVEGDRGVELTIGGRLSVNDTISGSSYGDILRCISATDKDVVTINGKIYKVYDMVNMDAVLTELYNSIEELNAADSVEAIVKGTVKSVSYEYLEHCPFTVYTLEISDCYKGMLNGTITIYEDGGYIPLADMQEDLTGHAEGFMDEINVSEYVMDMIFMGAEHVQAGDTLIAYLVPTSAPMRENSYRYVSSVFGRFILSDGVYERTMFEVENQDVQGQEVENNFENIISAEKMESVLKNIEH